MEHEPDYVFDREQCNYAGEREGNDTFNRVFSSFGGLIMCGPAGCDLLRIYGCVHSFVDQPVVVLARGDFGSSARGDGDPRQRIAFVLPSLQARTSSRYDD